MIGDGMDPIFDEMKKVPEFSSLSEAVSYVCGDGVVIDRLLNFMSDESGLPVLIDPAVYVGCNEADIYIIC